MTEVTENRAPAPSTPPVVAETTASSAPGRAKRGGVSTLIAVTALVAAAGASIAGYSGWQQLIQKQAALEARIKSEEQLVSGLQSASESDMQTLQQQLAALRESFTAAQQHDSRIDEGLADLNRRIEERRGNDWLVAEARHLINIASYQAQLNHDARTALTALETADQRLRDADDPALLKARQLLSSDIAALRAVASIDTPGIALLLGQLEQQVAGLPLAHQEEAPAAAPAGPATSTEPSGLERFFIKVWSDIKGLVTIRHNSGPQGSAITTPDQRIYLQQNLRLKLEVARLALLQRDTQTFRDTITTIRQWLEEYYDTQASATAAMLASLAPLATLELQPPLPDISNALHALDDRLGQHKGGAKVEAPLKRESSPS